jgi:hypothetical protein
MGVQRKSRMKEVDTKVQFAMKRECGGFDKLAYRRRYAK